MAFGTNDDANAVGQIIINTNLAAAAGAAGALFFTWLRYGKPDLSMTLNGALAGLVTITAGCAAVSAGSATLMGLIGGIVVVISIVFVDQVLKIDDPVGAFSVHGVCGTLGTILVGLFATDGGLFYGGGASLLGVQTTGALAYAAWAAVMAFIIFTILKVTIGVRVNEKDETEGLDIAEHGMNAYN